MNKFNSRISITYQTQLDEVDDYGNPIDSWAVRLASIPAEREVIKGSLKDIATREQAVLYYKFTVWSSAETRAILSSDRLTDLTSNGRIHSITSAYQTDDNRKIIILTSSVDNQSIYNTSND
jgi:hypothetical protein